MFKSIETYTIINNTTGITITGPGIVSVTTKIGQYGNANTGRLDIDKITNMYPGGGSIFLFKSSCRLYTDNYSSASITAVVALFND